jgi:hypothetical protein
VITPNFFAPLRTKAMNTETAGAENALPEHEIPRKSGRLPPIIYHKPHSTQKRLKRKRQRRVAVTKYTKWNCIITKEMADYSAMKSYLETNNLRYFTFSPNSEKPIKAVIHHLPPDTQAEDISNSLEDLCLTSLT